MNEPAPTSFTVELHDGTPVLLRLFVPADREAVTEAFRRLSVDSRYYRFWNGQEQIPDSVLNRFLNPVPGQHETWAAQDPQHPNEPGYGGASYWRSETDPDSAEVSFTVADEMQHRGLGTLLLAVLWLKAAAAGVSCFYGVVLSDNYTVLNWFRSLGANMRMDRGQYSFELKLNEAGLKDTAVSGRLKEWLGRLRAMCEVGKSGAQGA